MTPLDYYRDHCTAGLIFEDEEQLAVLDWLQKIHVDLVHEQSQRSRLLSLVRKRRQVKGLYLWGGVGVGKTFLMDCFYQSLPFQEKMRMHFHVFMRHVHAELKRHQGEKNPLLIIAKEIASRCLLLCFDEFFVNDIADAMILGRLLSALFAEGVCIVLTSNVMPDDLYKKGLQRPLFLPAIEQLKCHATVLHIPTSVDYRLRHLQSAGVFYLSSDQMGCDKMEETFQVLTEGKEIYYEGIEICGRPIAIKKQASDVIWFDFRQICHVPRSQRDYLAIADKYKTVFISDVPVIPAYAKDTITLFITLVDVFYDAHTRLVISAAASVDQLYTDGHLLFEYARTRSRLLEMQSAAYFANAHHAARTHV